MIKEIKKIRNNALDSINLEENHLSIQLSLDGFSFCIYNKIEDEVNALGIYKFENSSISPYKHLELVEELYLSEELLQKKYNSVSVTHFNNLVTQVPRPFFDKNNLTEYLQYTVKVLENDFISYDEIANSEIINVYIPYVNINNFLLDKYGSFIYKHSSTVLIEKLLNQYKNSENDYCFVNVTNTHFEIVVLKNKKLELFNCFSFTTKEDFIYYILFIAEQLNLNPEEFQLVLLGDIEKKSELYTILYQYVRNISFYTPTKFYPILKDISTHSNFTLLNQL
ncbi:DUF3822 family protein [Lutibacter sp. B1]|uniref:DUF3822 family protein n=1 Tax=Lutibacter sp. B1 TaxID=2725996 RepID=UPI001456A66B|nr:DUF3822 family protein [Lutibacter sp. B1]NLP57933.1 DUF3822 family protein [Lutibacter sp. B1]